MEDRIFVQCYFSDSLILIKYNVLVQGKSADFTRYQITNLRDARRETQDEKTPREEEEEKEKKKCNQRRIQNSNRMLWCVFGLRLARNWCEEHTHVFSSIIIIVSLYVVFVFTFSIFPLLCFQFFKLYLLFQFPIRLGATHWSKITTTTTKLRRICFLAYYCCCCIWRLHIRL